MLDQLFDTRHTVRLFLDTPVPNEDIDKIIAAAEKAPSKNCLKPYKIMAFTNTDEGTQVKQHLCRNVCLTKWIIDKDDQYPRYDFDRNSIITPKIQMRQELKQIEAPLTLAFVGQWIADYSSKDSVDYGHGLNTADNYDRYSLEDVIRNGDIEVSTRVIRDCMLSCSWAQLKAQELGYDTAFVGIGEQHDNDKVNENGIFTLNDSENIIILLCIGKEDKTRWEGTRVQVTGRRGLSNEITEIAFFEKHRKGEAAARGNQQSTILKI